MPLRRDRGEGASDSRKRAITKTRHDTHLGVDLGDVFALAPLGEVAGEPGRLEPGPHHVRLGVLVRVVAVLPSPVVQRGLHGRAPLGLQARRRRAAVVDRRRRRFHGVPVVVVGAVVGRRGVRVVRGRRLGPPPEPQPQLVARVQHERRYAHATEDRVKLEKYSGFTSPFSLTPPPPVVFEKRQREIGVLTNRRRPVCSYGLAPKKEKPQLHLVGKRRVRPDY